LASVTQSSTTYVRALADPIAAGPLLTCLHDRPS
jgi:hypothetical protein